MTARSIRREITARSRFEAFREAAASAVAIRIEDQEVRVATLPAIFVLKSFAFHERMRREDIEDAMSIVGRYNSAMDASAFFDLLDERDDLAFEDAGPWRLGRDIRATFERSTRDALAEAWGEMLKEGSPHVPLFPHSGVLYLDARDEEIAIFVETIRLILASALLA